MSFDLLPKNHFRRRKENNSIKMVVLSQASDPVIAIFGGHIHWILSHEYHHSIEALPACPIHAILAILSVAVVDLLFSGCSSNFRIWWNVMWYMLSDVSEHAKCNLTLFFFFLTNHILWNFLESFSAKTAIRVWCHHVFGSENNGLAATYLKQSPQSKMPFFS